MSKEELAVDVFSEVSPYVFDYVFARRAHRVK